MKKNRHTKKQGLDQEQFLSEEEHHRRLWLQYVLQTPMPWPRHSPSTSNQKNPYGTDS